MMPQRSQSRSPEQQQALDVITALCGGEEYVSTVAEDLDWLEVEAFSSDDLDGPRRIAIGIDGRVSDV